MRIPYEVIYEVYASGLEPDRNLTAIRQLTIFLPAYPTLSLVLSLPRLSWHKLLTLVIRIVVGQLPKPFVNAGVS